MSVCLMFLYFFLKAVIPKITSDHRKKVSLWDKTSQMSGSIWWLVVRFKQTTCLFYAFPLSVSKMEGAQTSLLACADILRWQEKL